MLGCVHGDGDQVQHRGQGEDERRVGDVTDIDLIAL